jgi:uncharacterized peroxidase-related enzyme
MTFIRPADDSAEMEAYYAADRDDFGYVRNLTPLFSHAPEVLAAWLQLNGAIKARMDLRRYELATIAAARRIRSSYCSLAHGSVLLDKFVDADQLVAIMKEPGAAGLDDVDTAVMELADKVATDATSVTEADVERLRSLGLTDSEVFDVVSAAAARCFFSKLLDGLGAHPDAAYADLDPAVRDALTVGRDIASA